VLSAVVSAALAATVGAAVMSPVGADAADMERLEETESLVEEETIGTGPGAVKR
jgi:hypothetical protein